MASKKLDKMPAAPAVADSTPTVSSARGFLNFPEATRQPWSYFLRSYKGVVDGVDREIRDGAAINLAEYEILLQIKRSGGRMRFIDLANRTLLSQSRISRQIDSLQAKGLLYREITDADRRATFAVLTKAGQKVFDTADQVFVRALHAHFLDRIPEDQLGKLTNILAGLLDGGDLTPPGAPSTEPAKSPGRSRVNAKT